jgi:hypothetical protein
VDLLGEGGDTIAGEVHVQLYVTPLFWTTHVTTNRNGCTPKIGHPFFGKIIARETEKWAKVIGAAKADGRRRWPGGVIVTANCVTKAPHPNAEDPSEVPHRLTWQRPLLCS